MEENMQDHILEKGKLLGPDGNLLKKGYATNYLLEYDRLDITAPKWRIKEWDYYYIGNDDFAICLTISDMGYIGAISATVIDFKEKWQITKSAVDLFPMGKYKMPSSTKNGDASAKIGKVQMTFENDGKTRKLYGSYPKFGNDKETLAFDITLDEFPKECMFIATPFDKHGYFYYNAKINCMRANGTFTLGKRKYIFENDLGTLDWGRGVWTYNNTWYWGSLQTRVRDGSTFGFNIGYGFGDTSAASENMLFYKGLSHKLEDVKFIIPGEEEGKDDYMSPWKFTSSDGRFEMNFTPILDRYAPVDLKFMAMIPHQVFGKFSGKAILDDGTIIELKDTLGFAEKVHNKW